MKRKNPKEDYLDKKTIWPEFHINELLFAKIIANAIDNLNIYRLNKRSHLMEKILKDGSFQINEIEGNYAWDEERKILSTLFIAGELRTYYSENLNNIYDRGVSIYTRFKSSNKWHFEMLVPRNENLIQVALSKILMENFRTLLWDNWSYQGYLFNLRNHGVII